MLHPAEADLPGLIYPFARLVAFTWISKRASPRGSTVPYASVAEKGNFNIHATQQDKLFLDIQASLTHETVGRLAFF